MGKTVTLYAPPQLRGKYILAGMWSVIGTSAPLGNLFFETPVPVVFG